MPKFAHIFAEPAPGALLSELLIEADAIVRDMSGLSILDRIFNEGPEGRFRPGYKSF